MNCTNANKELGFDKFSECNYNLHWSFSNFNRILMVAGQIAQLPIDSKVLELGAGSSDLENIVKKNFGRKKILGFYLCYFSFTTSNARFKHDTILSIQSVCKLLIWQFI